MHDAILRTLVDLETQLHRIEVRRDRQRMEELLHPEFEEIGRSGRRYSREEVLSEFRSGGELQPVHAEDFSVALLAHGLALLTYRSAHVDGAGKLYRWTLRSSLWMWMDQRWRMRFHQGTPADE